MNRTRKIRLGLLVRESLVVSSVIAGVFLLGCGDTSRGRYEIVTAGAGLIVHRLDRESGQVCAFMTNPLSGPDQGVQLLGCNPPAPPGFDSVAAEDLSLERLERLKEFERLRQLREMGPSVEPEAQ